MLAASLVQRGGAGVTTLDYDLVLIIGATGRLGGRFRTAWARPAPPVHTIWRARGGSTRVRREMLRQAFPEYAATARVILNLARSATLATARLLDACGQRWYSALLNPQVPLDCARLARHLRCGLPTVEPSARVTDWQALWPGSA